VIDRNPRGTHPDEWKQLMGTLQGAPRDEAGSWFGEALKLDLFASRAPSYAVGYFSVKYWEQYLAHPDPTSLLALESEWKGGSAEERYTCVMHSAAKLAIVNTKLKVLVFCAGRSNKKLERRGHFLEHVGALRAKHPPLVPWLVIDVPNSKWDAKPPAAFVSNPKGEGWEPLP
jgi:hypothetical protein